MISLSKCMRYKARLKAGYLLRESLFKYIGTCA